MASNERTCTGCGGKFRGSGLANHQRRCAPLTEAQAALDKDLEEKAAAWHRAANAVLEIPQDVVDAKREIPYFQYSSSGKGKRDHLPQGDTAPE
ncbi:hypothetical protein H0H92_005299 [Tricholoma furcatifolium]|nr:hypothetical protein H0H92_005299 [Tricholoma furcatifolium]